MSIYAHLVGRIGRDAEVRYTPSGAVVAGFPVATDHGYGDNKKTIWIECSIWGERAEKVAPHLIKGKQISVHGELHEETWQKKDGSEGKRLKLDVRSFDFCGGKEEGGERSQAEKPKAAPRPQTTASQYSSARSGSAAKPPAADFHDDDIPF